MRRCRQGYHQGDKLFDGNAASAKMLGARLSGHSPAREVILGPNDPMLVDITRIAPTAFVDEVIMKQETTTFFQNMTKRKNAMRPLVHRTVFALLLGALGALPLRAQESRPVLVFAAASLQTALNAIAAEWQKETGKQVKVSYAASSVLARQIEQGAPADLFASADLDWMDWAAGRKLIKAGTRRTLLGNTLVLIAPKELATSLVIAPGFPLAQEIGDSRLATGNPQSVPVGKYARQALTALSVWDQVGPRIAGADNVRAALSLVARGEAKFGIVYETDARTEPRVRVVGTFPANTHQPVVYPFAVTAISSNPDAEAFLAYLSSSTAQRVFEAEGFSTLK